MANINDFKLIAKKSEKYADLLLSSSQSKQTVKNQTDKERIGFYLFILENICGIQDISDLKDLITDTEFNRLVLDEEKNDDCGIDAVYINDEECSIKLFNFKYRERFKPEKQQSPNDVLISAKFINVLSNGDTRALKGKLKDFADSIIEKLNGKDEWKLYLYTVSNENAELQASDENVEQLAKHYGLEVRPIGLAEICQYMSIRPKPVSAKLTLDIDAVMSFSEDPISSSKSYIVRLPINEIIRITCNSDSLRNNCNLEDLDELKDAELEYSVLFDNVRGSVMRSKYNENISETLKKEPSKFFMYNNGLTLIAEDVEGKLINGKKKMKLELTSFQVINGGQTLRKIHDFHKLDKSYITEYLSNGQVLVRIFKTTKDQALNNKIAEYTNSQNSISSVDLKSLRTEQMDLEKFLGEHKIVYSRKTGDTGLNEKEDYEYKVSMERFGQILYSLKGYPHRASNRKKKIFDEYYNDVFGEENLVVQASPDQIRKYFEIESIYRAKAKEEKTYKSTDQKIFYILYLQANTTKSIAQLIDTFEKAIDTYKHTGRETISLATKLSQPGFKDHIDKEFSIC